VTITTVTSTPGTGGGAVTCAPGLPWAPGTAVTCTVTDTLGGGDLADLTFAGTLATAACPPGTAITNTATIATTGFELGTANNTASETTTVACPVLAVNKALSGGAPGTVNTSVAGAATSFDITVSETGGVAPALGVMFTDTLPAGFTAGALPLGCAAGPGANQFTCTIGTIAAGGTSAVFTIPVTAGTAAPCGTATNSVTASSAGTTTTATDTQNVTVQCLDVVVTKTSQSIGATSQAQITITNTSAGGFAATNIVMTDVWTTLDPTFVTAIITNTIPTFPAIPTQCIINDSFIGFTPPAATDTGTVTCTIPSLAAGATQIITVTLTTSNDPGNAAPNPDLTNTASVTLDQGDPTGNNAATSTVDVGP
jgi:large repetitive protein